MLRRYAQFAAVVALLGLTSQVVAAEKPASKDAKSEETKFLRLERDAKKLPLSLQTAVVSYVSADNDASGPTVDLIGAVHVGEKSYYEELNKLFEKYDVVLYELVAPPGTRIEKGAKPGSHPIAMLQGGMKDMLDLEHQLQYIDYTKENLVHADMSPDEFDKKMTERGESMWTMMFRMMGEGMARQADAQARGKSFDAELLMALFDKRRSVALKRVLAEQFEDMGGMMAALDGPEGSTIITERNKVAFKQLARQIESGKKRIGVFYGAGHLPDMERRLIAEFKLKRGEQQWFTAWRLGDDAKPKAGDKD